jgi:hypothetical protein
VLEDLVERDGRADRESACSIDVEALQDVDPLDVDKQLNIASAAAQVDEEVSPSGENGRRRTAFCEKSRRLGHARGSLVVETSEHVRLLPPRLEQQRATLLEIARLLAPTGAIIRDAGQSAKRPDRFSGHTFRATRLSASFVRAVPHCYSALRVAAQHDCRSVLRVGGWSKDPKGQRERAAMTSEVLVLSLLVIIQQGAVLAMQLRLLEKKHR